MKKLLILLLISVMMLSLGGCARSCSIQIGNIGSNTNHKMTASYYKMDGTKTKELTVKEGEPIDIAAKIKTKSGSIDVLIYNEDKENVYEGYDIQTSSFDVPITEPGQYTIEIKTDNHKGSYSFQW